MRLISLLVSIGHVAHICSGFSIGQASEKTLTEQQDHKGLEKAFLNRDHVRRKRYLGLSRKFKLNKRYQECVGPGDAKGHCKHLNFCPVDVLKSSNHALENLCIIEKTFVGVCCPDDIALSGVIGSLLILDLPASGDDYDESDNNTGCGIPEEGRTVTATKATTLQEWPWMAALYKWRDLQSGNGQQFCGGALITEQHILTAAHCTQGLVPQDIRVRLGEYDFTKFNETRSTDYHVAEIINHENFEVASYDNDIAILRLMTPTSFNTYIWPICLPPTGETFENETAVVAGWGQEYYGGPTSPVLLQVAIPIWNLEKCQEQFLQRITERNLCAAAYEGGKDSCQGDSGGPLMYQLPNGRWVTIGVVSWGIECGNKGSPGIYTMVNKYIPWIVKNTIAKK